MRCAHKSASSILLLAATIALATCVGSATGSESETIQANSSQNGKLIVVTLTVFNYSSSTDLQVLSQAFHEGQDRGLAIALSKTKAVGRCSIAGAIGYDVAFIQMVPTATGRKIVFITNRPHPLDEADPPQGSESFDLAVGQFDLNDTDKTKSTGFLFPSSKLAIDDQGVFHYDLAGSSWSLVDILDSPGAPALAKRPAADAIIMESGSLAVQLPISKNAQLP
jgi:hypothetical protein